MTPGVEYTPVAESYDRMLVPGIFAPLAAVVADAVEAAAGDHALDVACGTGALTRVLAERVAPGGEVLGCDPSEGMIAVARSHGDGIEYVVAEASALPFADGRFSVVTCQQGLQFTADPVASLRELARVAAPGGRLAVACWCDLEHDVGFLALAQAADEHLGPEAGRAVRGPFRIADPAEMRGHLESAGIDDVVVEIERVAARVPVRPDRFGEAVMTAGPAGAAYAAAPEPAREAFAEEVARLLQPHADGDAVVFEMPSLIAVARV